jgi:hypothetical protein
MKNKYEIRAHGLTCWGIFLKDDSHSLVASCPTQIIASKLLAIIMIAEIEEEIDWEGPKTSIKLH